MLVDVKYALETALVLCGLKEKQKEALLVFINGNDVYVSLPIGYGKYIIYGIFPLVYDTLKSKKSFEVQCSLFFTLNVLSERFASQNQQSAVIILYTVCIMLRHVCSNILIALAPYLKTTKFQ